ncbi:unnamed protein product [Lampetra planeri]
MALSARPPAPTAAELHLNIMDDGAPLAVPGPIAGANLRAGEDSALPGHSPAPHGDSFPTGNGGSVGGRLHSNGFANGGSETGDGTGEWHSVKDPFGGGGDFTRVGARGGGGSVSRACRWLRNRRWRAHWRALRPWSFGASLAPVALGAALAWRADGTFRPAAFAATLACVLCVHGAGNLVNTYYDFVRGVDSGDHRSDDRTLVDGLLAPAQVVRLGALLYSAGCAGALALAAASPLRNEHLALLYFGGLSSSFLYTGGIGLKYVAMGDALIFVTFGPLSVLFAFSAQTGRLAAGPLAYGLPLALLAQAALHANNARDAEGDRAAGAVTLAMVMGPAASYALYIALLLLPFAGLAAGAARLRAPTLAAPLAALPLALRLERRFRAGTLRDVPQGTARLGLAVGLLYAAGVLLAPPGSLPGLT